MAFASKSTFKGTSPLSFGGSRMSKIRKLTSVAAAAGICALMAASPAQAYVYATSALQIENLLLNVAGAGTTINSYTFNLSNSASMNGGPSSSSGACNSLGFPACSAISPVLDAAEVNAAGSTLNRANNNYAFLGADQVNSYSGADSVINTAQLVQAVPTSTRQIAESLLNINGFAQANALVQSNTSLTATLNVVGVPASLSLSFDADPDQRSQINGAPGTYLSQSDLNASFTLSGNGGSVTWTPNGTGANDCTVTGALVGLGVACAETFDTQDLNRNTTTSSNPGTDDNSFDLASTLTAFGINITGLTAGTYTIAFNAQTSTSIIRAVPEPGMMALLGAGLLGLGAIRRRRQA